MLELTHNHGTEKDESFSIHNGAVAACARRLSFLAASLFAWLTLLRPLLLSQATASRVALATLGFSATTLTP